MLLLKMMLLDLGNPIRLYLYFNLTVDLKYSVAIKPEMGDIYAQAIGD
jgi:hypothetical protein